MEYFTERESALSEGLFSFAPLFYKDYKLKKIKRTGMAMIVGTSQMERVRGLLVCLTGFHSQKLFLYTHLGTDIIRSQSR